MYEAAFFFKDPYSRATTIQDIIIFQQPHAKQHQGSSMSQW